MIFFGSVEKKSFIPFPWKLDNPYYHRQHKEALENLKRKQEEVEHTATKKQAEIIEQLKIKITDLEVDRNAQNERHQELILEMAEMKKYGPESIASDMEAPCDNLEIDQIMAKLEQDNKFLEDLEKQRSSKAVNKANSDSSTSSSSSNNQRFVKEWIMKSSKKCLHLQIIPHRYGRSVGILPKYKKFVPYLFETLTWFMKEMLNSST